MEFRKLGANSGFSWSSIGNQSIASISAQGVGLPHSPPLYSRTATMVSNIPAARSVKHPQKTSDWRSIKHPSSSSISRSRAIKSSSPNSGFPPGRIRCCPPFLRTRRTRRFEITAIPTFEIVRTSKSPYSLDNSLTVRKFHDRTYKELWTVFRSASSRHPFWSQKPERVLKRPID